jgi:hypothetical protein
MKEDVMRKTLATLHLIAGTTLTTIAAYEVIKNKIRQIAEIETVRNEREYILVRLARGDYNKSGGFEMMKYDYRFFKIISNFHE